MHLEVEKTTEEVQARLWSLFATIRDRLVHELLCLKHLVILNVLVHEVSTQRVSVRAHYRNDLQAVRILIWWELLPSFCEELARH